MNGASGPAHQDDATAALVRELAETRARLADVEEVLNAIRSGDVDAVMVRGEHGDQVYTLTGADLAYRQLIETMIEGALTLSHDGIILYCNQRLSEALGRPLDEIMGSSLRDYIAPEDQMHFASILAEARIAPSRGEVTIALAGGERKPVHLSVSRLQAPGTALLFCLAATDLTETRRHEEVAAAERLARSILEQSAEIIVVCDDKGRIIRMSRTAEPVCGPDALMHSFAECVPLRTENGRLFELASVMAGQSLHNLDVSLERGGQHVDMLLNANPLRQEEQIRGCVVNLTDITARKQDETALRVRGAALNAAATAMVITDRAGRISWVNPAFSSLTGYSVHELAGRSPGELEAEKLLGSEFDRQLARAVQLGEEWHGEVTNGRKDGTQFVEDLTITPVRDARGEITHFVVLNRDLTEARTLQARLIQSQKLETVGRLAGGIAHDFNNILTVISGIVDLSLGDIDAQTPLHTDLIEVQRSVNRASALTRQLLAFSRQQVLQATVLDVNVLVRNLVKMLHRLIDEDIRLELMLADALAPVLADAGQLEQVIVNLVINARDAIPHGGTIQIVTRNVTADAELQMWHGALPAGPYVVLGVRDTGVGMDEATLAGLFEPFFTTKPVGQGTGLGLATVHGIVIQSGGGIQVTTDPGRGSEFLIYLPCAPGLKLEQHASSPTSVARGSEVILVVDDEPALRSVTTRILVRSGFRVLSAASAAEAMQLLATHDGPVHLLLTDVVMPGMSGPKLVELVQQAYPAIKILFMSGYTDDTVLRHGVNSQQTQFIDKPFTMQTLNAKVRGTLDGDATY